MSYTGTRYQTTRTAATGVVTRWGDPGVTLDTGRFDSYRHTMPVRGGTTGPEGLEELEGASVTSSSARTRTKPRAQGPGEWLRLWGWPNGGRNGPLTFGVVRRTAPQDDVTQGSGTAEMRSQAKNPGPVEERET